MFTVQFPEGDPHTITLSQSEMDVCQSIADNRDGTFTCKSCAGSFTSIMNVITHALTNCDAPRVDFESISAIRICMMFDQPGATKLLQTHMQLQADEADSEVCPLPATWTVT